MFKYLVDICNVFLSYFFILSNVSSCIEMYLGIFVNETETELKLKTELKPKTENLRAHTTFPT